MKKFVIHNIFYVNVEKKFDSNKDPSLSIKFNVTGATVKAQNAGFT